MDRNIPLEQAAQRADDGLGDVPLFLVTNPFPTICFATMEEPLLYGLKSGMGPQHHACSGTLHGPYVG